jgi:hypothetical protein
MNAMFKQTNLFKKVRSNLVKDLPFAAQMSIWGIRILASGYRAEMDVTKPLIEGFRKCNATQAGSNLLFLMEIVFSGLTRNIEIYCACNQKLNDDENELLNLLSFSQHYGIVSEQIGLVDFLSNDAVNNVIPLFNGYGDAMRDAGLLLPVCEKSYVELLSISELMKPSLMSH